MYTLSESLCLSQSSTTVVSSPKSILQQRNHTQLTVHGEITGDALKPVLQSCQRRIRSWRVPPNWSPRDWFEEIEAVQAIAAWQASRAYDPSRGINYAAFVYQKVMACALTRYRQEWTYALRVVSTGQSLAGRLRGTEHPNQLALPTEATFPCAGHLSTLHSPFLKIWTLR